MSEITWESIVEQYKERAVCDGARIDELTQRANHWHDTAQMLKRQRDTAEEERDWWKLRAMQSEQQRQSLRDQLILAEGQRDQAKADAEDIGNNWQRSLDAMIEQVRPYLARHGLAVQPTTGGADE